MEASQQTAQALRLDRGWTLYELAAKAHVSYATVARIDQGERSPRGDHAMERRIADALGVPWERVGWGRPGADLAGLKLAQLREAQGLTPTQVARRTGLTLGTVLRAEQGEGISVHNAKRLADFYGVKVTDFFSPNARSARPKACPA